MTRIGRFLGAVLVAGSSTQCLLFTEPPNVQPRITLQGPEPGPTVLKTHQAIFKARVEDDGNPAAVRLQWFEREQSCPASLTEARLLPLAATGATHMMTREKEGAFCVGVIATDDKGASAFDALRFDVVNQPPEARIQLVAPSSSTAVGATTASAVPLYSEVRLSGKMSTDTDDPPERLRYRWKITPPAGAPEPPACSNGTVVADGPELCRRLNTAGDYRFELTVHDGQVDSAAPATLTLTAGADSKPCFERTEPPHDLARSEDGLPPLVLSPFDRPYTFRVLEVHDDGDAYPTASGTIPGSFSWQWREPGQTTFERLVDPTLTSFTIEANRYRPGDEIAVRVDYRDRQPLEVYTCLKEPAADRCETPVPPEQRACYHRVSWRLRFIP